MELKRLEDYQQQLKLKLDKDALMPGELTAGIRECFFICQYRFVAKRQPDKALTEVKRFSDELVTDVFEELSIEPGSASPVMLRQAINILNARFEFCQDAELMEIHQTVIDGLFSKPIVQNN